ncbi:two-component hybrid sensor and regulator [Richelia sinica FACHB-800]|uniref:histidine kinase n=1 Tax=Richelia sinica FACHB-800 TaxID=1357546 RepID=A0A975T5A3_9NOST|nr:response regulator [Richelia sinica]MBD2666862.1 hybrid sensor histidine kinase/response regulator [Richelia sinica FACHB-800]QXE22402.1 two-component hybrid sensor and regulator [Richelia sinica FACHB-800]
MDIPNENFLADILIVDDKLENIRFLSDFLSQQNYQIRKAINGQAALTAIEAIPPDLVLLDINMPILGGYEVCEALKKDPKTNSIPIIFLSAGNEVVDKVKAFQVGGVDYITKPFYLEEVLVRIQTHLKIKQLQKELESRNNQLEKTLLTLQNTQAELVQKEKLVNSSRIVAGISHEINNPLSFIVGNINPASEYSQHLIKLIQNYQQAFPDATPEIKNIIKDIDLDFVITDFTRIMKSMHRGAERIHSVIQALHIFSRLDKSGINNFDIHENIDSVLKIINHQLILKAGDHQISIIKEYTDIPNLIGYPNLFNQVLVNIFQNAIDALEMKLNTNVDSSFKPTICISTYVNDYHQVCISIKDNGIGILEENQAHIFEPFFTTKVVGKGAGLGLFTSHQVITDLHKGSLIYKNCPEGGAEFIITVPIRKYFR